MEYISIYSFSYKNIMMTFIP